MKKYHINMLATPLNACISIPGSKSYTARALVAATLSPDITTLTHVSNSNDSKALIAGLRKLGVHIEQNGSTVSVHGWGTTLPSVQTHIDIGPAGTPARFLIALCSLLPHSDITITGDAQMNSRPIGPLVDALRSLGAQITYTGKNGCPPVRIQTKHGLTGQHVELDGSISSQFFSALMLIAPALKRGLRISVDGKLTSASYVAMTAQTIEQFGAQVTSNPGKSYTVNGRYKAQETYTIEADASGAMNFLGLAAISSGSITISNLPLTSLQGDLLFLDMMRAMGCTARGDAQHISLSRNGPLRGLTYDMNQLPDSAMVAGVVAAFANSPTTLSGLGTLKHKETDRMQALHEQLLHIGASSTITKDTITIHPTSSRSITIPSIQTYNDHRFAMAFACVAAVNDVLIENPDVVGKSFPEFWEKLSECGVSFTEIDS